LTDRSRRVTTVEIDDTYRFLLGRWQVERTLTDHRLHETGVFSGTATVAPRRFDGRQTAQYRERGELRFGGYRGTASRRLGYVRMQDGAVSMTFEDGRRFVACDLRSGRCLAAHLCSDDRYDVSWLVLARDVIVEQWRVRGPLKDYEARCVSRRLRTHGPAVVS
jgi:hypothetical protein